MTTPDVPLRLEITIEVTGTPELVWDAIATGGGLTSWFLPTDVEEREGGSIVTHMGDTSSPGTVTGWDPPRRFAYEEPGWAALGGHEGAPVTPLATEFLVEAQSGGTTVVRVVSSAFGTGADWEREFFEEMEKGWLPWFDRLRLYLSDFPGQQATPLALDAKVDGTKEAALDAMRADLGIESAGQTVDGRGLAGEVVHVLDQGVLVRVREPVPGLFGFGAWDTPDGGTVAAIQAHFFSDGAPSYVEREGPAWKSWLETLDLKSTSASTKSR
jgi:uncharacterized protein YndB with AHSA1/START domain